MNTRKFAVSVVGALVLGLLVVGIAWACEWGEVEVTCGCRDNTTLYCDASGETESVTVWVFRAWGDDLSGEDTETSDTYGHSFEREVTEYRTDYSLSARATGSKWSSGDTWSGPCGIEPTEEPENTTIIVTPKPAITDTVTIPLPTPIPTPGTPPDIPISTPPPPSEGTPPPPPPEDTPPPDSTPPPPEQPEDDAIPVSDMPVFLPVTGGEDRQAKMAVIAFVLGGLALIAAGLKLDSREKYDPRDDEDNDAVVSSVADLPVEYDGSWTAREWRADERVRVVRAIAGNSKIERIRVVCSIYAEELWPGAEFTLKLARAWVEASFEDNGRGQPIRVRA